MVALLPVFSGDVMATTAPTSGDLPIPAAHSLTVDLLLQLIGVSVMAIAADFGPNIGKIMVLLMVGFVIIWMLANVKFFSKIAGII